MRLRTKKFYDEDELEKSITYFQKHSETYESVFSTHKLVSSDIQGLLGVGDVKKGS